MRISIENEFAAVFVTLPFRDHFYVDSFFDRAGNEHSSQRPLAEVWQPKPSARAEQSFLGISNSEQFQAAGKFADGVVVGSAIVQTIEKNAASGRAAQAVGEFIRGLKKHSAQQKQSALSPQHLTK